MKFFTQLKLLVWKNFTLRRRQTLRNVIELLWPLVLFIILVAVRQRRPPDHISNSYFRPRAMPSAGLLPFARSFVCDVRNTKEKYSPDTNLPDIQQSSFIKLVEDALPLIGNKTLRDRLLRIDDDYMQLRRDQNMLADLFGNTTRELNFTKFLKSPANFTKFLVNEMGIKPSLVEELLQANVDLQKLRSLLGPTANGLFPQGDLPGNMSGLSALLVEISNNPQQRISWLIQHGLLGQMLQGQLTEGELARALVCYPDSPVKIDSVIHLPRSGNLTELKEAFCALNNEKLNKLVVELQNQFIWPAGLPNATYYRNRRMDLQNVIEDLQALNAINRVIRDYGRVVRGMRNGTNHVLCGDVQTATNESSGFFNADPGDLQETLAPYEPLFNPDDIRNAWRNSTRGCDALINQVYSKYIVEVDGAAKNGTSIGTYDNIDSSQTDLVPTNIQNGFPLSVVTRSARSEEAILALGYGTLENRREHCVLDVVKHCIGRLTP